MEGLSSNNVVVNTLTLLVGILVFVGGQLVGKFLIEPLHEQRKCIGAIPDALIFYAGTKAREGQILTDGGRVLTVVGMGKTIAEARAKVYRNIPRIQFDGCHYRRDIAAREEES